MTTYRIDDEASRKMAMARLTQVPAGEGWRCRITRTDKRKDSQNALNWKWCTAIAEQMHDSKDDVHARNKHDFGVPILCRDEPEFNEMWTKLSEQLSYEEQVQAIRYIDVTSIMSVKQMTEYLNDLELHYERNGILLPKLDDDYFEAQGYKRSAA